MKKPFHVSKVTRSLGRFQTRNRFYVARSYNASPWMVVDSLDGCTVDFDLRSEAEQAAVFCRRYVKKWGDIDLATYPWSLETPLRYEPWEGREWNRHWLNEDGSPKAG